MLSLYKKRQVIAMENKENFDAESVLKMAQAGDGQGAVELAMHQLSESQRRQVEQVMQNRQALEKIMESKAARELMRRLGKK